jgi:hypothetical protein
LQSDRDFWQTDTGVGDAKACLGVRGCRRVWIHISEHPDDIDGAKEIAAFYCVDHADECHTEAYFNTMVHDDMTDLLFLGAGVAGRAGSARAAGEAGAEARAASGPAADPGPAGPDLVRVGRWMSRDEYDGMVKTGKVQGGAAGVTYAVHPAAPESFGRQAVSGSGYAEFDVPADSV